MERVWKPNVEISPSCPRCGSSNTKFCYYNNYSLTQPRYFCKGCRRYWTRGGSLRNVPVGGGCRKNRRGKSLRLSTEGVGSKGLCHGGSHSDPIGNSYGSSRGSALVESSSSSSLSTDGSHIDLALVYANFLNRQPEPKSSGDEIPNLPRNCDHPNQEFSSISNTNIQESSCMPLTEENGLGAGCLSLSDRFADTHLNEPSDQLYFGGFDPIHKPQDRIEPHTSHEAAASYVLPPLPGEEIASQDIDWSSQMMVNHAVQTTPLPVLGPEAQDTNSLLGNWNPFDLSSEESFLRN